MFHHRVQITTIRMMVILTAISLVVHWRQHSVLVLEERSIITESYRNDQMLFWRPESSGEDYYYKDNNKDGDLVGGQGMKKKKQRNEPLTEKEEEEDNGGGRGRGGRRRRKRRRGRGRGGRGNNSSDDDDEDLPPAYQNGTIIRPPFYVVQIGVPRSGSTFQAALLKAILELKLLASSEYQPSDLLHSANWVNDLGVNSTDDRNTENQQAATIHNGITNNSTHAATYPHDDKPQQFFLKTHNFPQAKKLLTIYQRRYSNIQLGVNFHFFVSKRDGQMGLKPFEKRWQGFQGMRDREITLFQSKQDLVNCSLCEIDRYRPMFDLSNEEIQMLKNYMSKFEILRQCCGTQQSKFNRYRLHGCNVTELLEESTPNIHYPYCENRNLSEIELEYESILPEGVTTYPGQKEARGTLSWNQPGDCERFESLIRDDGWDFNMMERSKFTGDCDAFARGSGIPLKRLKKRRKELRNYSSDVSL